MAKPLDHAAILSAAGAAVAQCIAATPPVLPLWDGHAGQRVAEALARWASDGPK